MEQEPILVDANESRANSVDENSDAHFEQTAEQVSQAFIEKMDKIGMTAKALENIINECKNKIGPSDEEESASLQRTDTVPVETETDDGDKRVEEDDEQRVEEYRKELDSLHQKLLKHILDAPASVPKRHKQFAYENVKVAKMMLTEGTYVKQDVEF